MTSTTFTSEIEAMYEVGSANFASQQPGRFEVMHKDDYFAIYDMTSILWCAEGYQAFALKNKLIEAGYMALVTYDKGFSISYAVFTDLDITQDSFVVLR